MAKKTHVEMVETLPAGDSDADLSDETDEESVMDVGEANLSDGDDEVSGEAGPKSDHQGPIGLASAMAKILNKQLPKHTETILAKGLTEKEIRKRKLQRDKEALKSGQSTGNIDLEHETVSTEKKKLWEEMARVKPNPIDKDKERQLQRIATRGVVQLFNAVRKQQKIVEEKLSEVGSSEGKRSKVMKSMTKGAFLDLLKGTAANVSTELVLKEKIRKKKELNTAVKGDDEESKWSILREDFMMGASMKDWDKGSSSGDEAATADVESDSD